MQYPIVELATGIIFLLTIYFFQDNIFLAIGHWLLAIGILKIILLLALNSLLIITFVYDLKHKIIPDTIIYPAILLVFSYQLLAVWSPEIISVSSLFPIATSAILAGGFFYALAAISDGKWMGGGDIKLAFFMGLFLGWPNILIGLFLGFTLGAVFGVTLIALRKAEVQSEIPFGPFLITGTWIALFWGEKVVELYLKVMGLG